LLETPPSSILSTMASASFNADLVRSIKLRMLCAASHNDFSMEIGCS
jgi:hypothetical protein